MKRQLLWFVVLVYLSSCSPLLQPGFETPIVNVSSVTILPGDEIVPIFEIGLHVVNPNQIALKLQGLSYQVALEGHQVLFGVANQLPTIDAYGEGEVVLQARPDLFSTIKLFGELLSRPRDTVKYTFDASLDVGVLFPKIKVTKSGVMSLSDLK